MRRIRLTHQFVDFIPKKLEEGVVYVSLSYETAVHRCVCGCGREVVTPLSPTDWKVLFDGETITLDPSVGNWSFPCQSHYWIRKNTAIWGARWTEEQILSERANDRLRKSKFYEERRQAGAPSGQVRDLPAGDSVPNQGILSKLKAWLSR